MHKRDVGILLLACIAMVVSLQREGISSFRKAWYHDAAVSEEDMLVEHHELPAPVVADLNGDGHLEVVSVDPSLKIQVIAPVAPSRMASGFAPAHVIAEVPLQQQAVMVTASRRPVALQVGYLDPPPVAKGVRPLRKQVVVVVTAGLQVLVYDHNLKLMWEKSLQDERLVHHSHVKEVAVMVTHHQVHKGDRGLIVVGASIQRGDLASGEGLEVEGGGRVVDDEDVLDAAEREERERAARAHTAGADFKLEDLDANSNTADSGSSTRGLDASRHFDYHGLEGGTGVERWHHVATDFHKDLSEMANSLRPQNDYRLDAEKLEGRHFGEVSCRDYRESILHQALPHVWQDAEDTFMYAAHFVKHRVGRGAAKEMLALKNAKGVQPHSTASKGHHLPAPHKSSTLLSALHGSKGHAADSHMDHQPPHPHQHHHQHTGNVTVNSIVVHLEEGIEVIHLFTGRPVCQLHLMPQELHADINGDGVMDHVQVYRGADVDMEGGDNTALASEAGGRRHHGASHCTALTTSGIPPQHHMWQVRQGNGCPTQVVSFGSVGVLPCSAQANVCHNNRFLSQLGQGAGALLHGSDAAIEAEGEGVEILPPVFLPLPRMSKGYSAHHHGLVIVLNSRGELHALSARGRPIWQAYFPVEWEPQHESEQDAEEAAAAARIRPTLMAMSLHKHGMPSAVLAAGEDGAVIVSEHGHQLAAITFPSPPTRKLVVMDFNGDGLNDIIAITPHGILGYAQVQHIGGGTLSTLLMVAVACMALMLYNNFQAMSGTTGAAARKLRSTEYTD